MSLDLDRLEQLKRAAMQDEDDAARYEIGGSAPLPSMTELTVSSAWMEYAEALIEAQPALLAVARRAQTAEAHLRAVIEFLEFGMVLCRQCGTWRGVMDHEPECRIGKAVAFLTAASAHPAPAGSTE